MTEDQITKLRIYYHSIRGQMPVFEAAQHFGSIGHQPVDILEEELGRLEHDFPSFAPGFVKNRYFAHEGHGGPAYSVPGILSHLALVLGRLQIAIDTPQGIPVTQARVFAFTKDQALRELLERDYQEIQRAFIAKCWKSVIILSGGAIEAILVDLLLRDPDSARAAKNAPKEADLTKWDLANIINVGVELGLVNTGVDKLSHSVREYRNLVHPGNELRNKLTVEAEEAKIALEVLHLVHRDLAK